MVVQEPVQAAIWHALNHYAYTDAIFLAERLYAEVGSDEALFLLATCYYRFGKPVRAYSMLQSKGCPTAQCKFLLAQCCLEINKLAEAESVLAGNVLVKTKSPEDIINEFGDTACYALRLLGNVYEKTERTSKATDHYKRSLKLNPFLWSSFENLCHLGEKPDPTKIFQVVRPQGTNVCQPNVYQTPQILTPLVQQPSQEVLQTPQDTNESIPLTPGAPQAPQLIVDGPENIATDLNTPDQVGLPTPGPRIKSRLNKLPGRNLLGVTPSFSPMTPSFGVLPLEATPSPGIVQCMPFITPSPVQSMNLIESGQQLEPHKAPTKKPMTRRSQPQMTVPMKPPVFSQSGNTNTRDVQTPSSNTGNQNTNVPLAPRRSSRLFSHASSSVKENNKSQSTKKLTGPKAPAKRTKFRSSKTPEELNEINKAELGGINEKPATITQSQSVINMQKQSADGLMHLLQDIGKAYLALSQYDNAKAIKLFSELPSHHANTGWMMCQVGKAYFEMAEYQKAEQIFSEVRKLEPYHLEGMEIYSTTLWHLQREVQLSSLSQELTELDKNAPETWCTTGNCFSLQKEHDIAIKFFQRAVQVDPNFAYAYTLLGHEYVFTEELDKAMSCFRNAIRVDPRHYNAWYGVGMIYYKQEKFALAEVHYRKALSINSSPVLLCHIGVVQHALKKSDSALATLNKAIAADPKNPLCKFHRASILFANDKHKEALKELEELKEIVPKESLVYFLIGKVHKKLGNTHLALMNFSWAMDLDPKGANNQIKEAIDKRYVTDEEDPSQGLDDPSLGLDDTADRSSNTSSIMEADDAQFHAIESDESL